MITDRQLRDYEIRAKAWINHANRQVVLDLVAEVRRLREETATTEDLYRSAHTKYQRCAAALEFYAKPIHWMGHTEDSDIQTVLVAMKGNDPNGWGPAREALQKD